MIRSGIDIDCAANLKEGELILDASPNPAGPVWVRECRNNHLVYVAEVRNEDWARLFVAAPELLALARDFLRLVEDHDLRDHVDVKRHGALNYYAQNARAAIAKAEVSR